MDGFFSCFGSWRGSDYIVWGGLLGWRVLAINWEQREKGGHDVNTFGFCVKTINSNHLQAAGCLAEGGVLDRFCFSCRMGDAKFH